jgi:riboflavin biosynthesis pyrimidine reductase
MPPLTSLLQPLALDVTHSQSSKFTLLTSRLSMRTETSYMAAAPLAESNCSRRSNEGRILKTFATGSKLPFIHANFAIGGGSLSKSSLPSLDSISCPADWQRVHCLREKYDAVAVGARTWIIDKPRLNVRREHLGREPKSQPARIIFAGHHRCIVGSDNPSTNNPLTFVIGTEAPCGDAILIRTDTFALLDPLMQLCGYGIQSILVEGGPTLLHSFLSEGFVDRITCFVRTNSKRSAANAASDLLGKLVWKMKVKSLGEGVLLVWDKVLTL